LSSKCSTLVRKRDDGNGTKQNPKLGIRH
jgi:hypothetical protein